MDRKTLCFLKRLAAAHRSGGGDFVGYMKKVREYFGENGSFFDISDGYYAYFEEERAIAGKSKREHRRISGQSYLASTQFFTPEMISMYLASNVLAGLCGCDFSAAKYLDACTERGQNDMTEVKLLDPAVGTGNLLYAAAKTMVDVWIQGGKSEKEAKKLAARSIFGIDTDSCVANFAKAELEAYLGERVEIYGIPSFERSDFAGRNLPKPLQSKLLRLGVSGTLESFTDEEVSAIKKASESRPSSEKLSILARITELLGEKYDGVLINPPYLSSADYCKELDDFVSGSFAEFRSDLFAAFAVRCLSLLKDGGFLGMVAPYNWMFLKQFEPLRRRIIVSHSVKNLVKLPCEGYLRAVVYLSASVIKNGAVGESGSFINITSPTDVEGDLQNALRREVPYKYTARATDFEGYPSAVFAFWIGNAGENFKGARLSDYLDIRQGLATGDNKRFLRPISAVAESDIDFTANSLDEFIAGGKRYALYNKGGKFRKWFGNREYVIDFSDKAREKLQNQGNHLPSKGYYFKRGITWTLVSSKGVFGARLSENSVFDVGGSCGFPKNPDDLYPILAYLCSKVATYYLSALNPTVNTQVGDIKNLPYIEPSPAQKAEITALAKDCVSIARADWSTRGSATTAQHATRQATLLSHEARLNAIFISLYNLTSVLSPDLSPSDITLIPPKI